MKNKKQIFTILLGIAFLVQAISSLVSGAILFDPLIIDENISATMINVVHHMSLAKASIFLDVVTVIGITWLGVMLYFLIRKTNKVMAMTALALYILEAAMLFVSRMFGFAFILLSKEYVDSGDSSLIQLGNVLLQTKVFASAMAIIPFGIGAVIFYFLIYKSKTFPSWIPLWGTVTVIPILIGVPLNEFLISVPFALYLPYVPFEFFMGIFLLFYRFKNPEVKLILQD